MIQTLAATARLAALAAGLSAAPLAGATTFNTSDLETHGRWHSVTLTLGEERHFRALEQYSYSDTLLSLNFTPRVCDLPWLEVRVELDEHQAKSRVANLVPADLRVDHDTLHNGMAEFITQRGDSGFYVNFYLNEQELLIEEMRRGDTLRLRLTRAEEDYWFLSFALDGADAAIARAERQCEAAG